MEGSKYILLSLLLIPYSLFAVKKPQQAPLTTEQQQQFTYYWYAAKQAIVDERYADALVLLTFCEQINPQDGHTLNSLGIIYDALNDHEKAIDYFRRANQADPRDQWQNYTMALLAQDKRSEARRVMERALKANPKDEELLEQLRRLYTGNEDWKRALRMQDRIDAINGYDSYSAYNRMYFYLQQGKYKKAIAAVDKYLEQEPTDVRFWMLRLDLMERSKRPVQESYEVYEHVLTFVPRHPLVLNNYAWLLATHGGDLHKAEQMSQRALQQEPDNAVYLDTYGWILHLQGNDNLALFYLNKALNNALESNREEIESHVKAINK